MDIPLAVRAARLRTAGKARAIGRIAAAQEEVVAYVTAIFGSVISASADVMAGALARLAAAVDIGSREAAAVNRASCILRNRHHRATSRSLASCRTRHDSTMSPRSKTKPTRFHRAEGNQSISINFMR